MAITHSTSSLNFPEFCSAGAMRSEGCSRNTLALPSGCPFSIPTSKPSRSSDFCLPHATSNLSKSCHRISDAVLFPHPLLFPFTDVPCRAELLQAPVLQLSAPYSRAGLSNPYPRHFLAPLPLAFLCLKLISTSATSRAPFPLQTPRLSLYIEAGNLEGIQRRDGKRD